MNENLLTIWCCSFRLIFVKRPLHYKKSITKSRIHLALTAACVLTILETVFAYYFFRKDIKQSDIRNNAFNHKGLYSVYLINMGLTTGVITVSFIWTTVHLLWRKRKNKYMFDSRLSDTQESSSKVTTALTIALGVFIMTFIPAYTCAFGIRIVEVPHQDILIDASFLIHFINTFVNPFIYFVILKDFRKRYKSLLLCKKTVEDQGHEITTTNVLFGVMDASNDANHGRQF